MKRNVQLNSQTGSNPATDPQPLSQLPNRLQSGYRSATFVSTPKPTPIRLQIRNPCLNPQNGSDPAIDLKPFSLNPATDLQPLSELPKCADPAPIRQQFYNPCLNPAPIRLQIRNPCLNYRKLA